MTKSHCALVFPGQGSQHQGMLATLALSYPIVKDTFTEASAVLGYDLWQIVQTNPQQKLDETEYTQPALLAAGVAMYRALQHTQALQADALTGHSLGEYTALVCADAISFQDAVKLVALRGRLMQQAVPAGQGAMAAIIGLDDDVVVGICQQAEQGQVLSPANYNSVGQVVIAGDTAAVLRAIDVAKAKGAKLTMQLPVSVPSHCALMQPASDAFEQAIYDTRINMPKIPVYHNVDATVKTDIAGIRQALIHQLSQPVLWVDIIKALFKQDIHCFIECGPGKVLTGLIKRIIKGADVIALSTYDDFNALPMHAHHCQSC